MKTKFMILVISAVVVGSAEIGIGQDGFPPFYTPNDDYYTGWDCSPPMAVDSAIFFPRGRTRLQLRRPFKLGGAAFGGTRIAMLEVTTDGGKTWKQAEIVRNSESDHVWVFWEASLVFTRPGSYSINVRATDVEGNTQQEDDPDKYDGTNDGSVLKVRINRKMLSSPGAAP